VNELNGSMLGPSTQLRNLTNLFLLILTISLCLSPGLALSSGKAQDATPAQQNTAPADQDEPPPVRDALTSTKQQNIDDAWTKLTDALHNPKRPQIRIQALAALGTLGGNVRAAKMIAAAMKDSDVDVRTAAVLAAGETYAMSRSRGLIVPLHDMLHDKEPQVVFTAASTLWKMHDHTGADVLMAVADGDRRANATLMHGTMETMSRDLHDPATLARIGALQGATMLLGPFGFGITAYEYVRKNGGDSARALAIEEISQIKTPAVRKELIGAISDKDPAVRAAAAKALGQYHEPDVSTAILYLFADPKAPVRLTGAASYLRSAGGAPGARVVNTPDTSSLKSPTIQ
jgi:HEAT repeat protein